MSNATSAEGDSREFGEWWRATGEHELRQLLFWVWDPVDIKDAFPATADQYDRYALEIATALASGMSTEVLATLLATIERARMGVSSGRANAVASRLADWYQDSRRRSGSAVAATG
ncbi:MAG: hypothetical protein WAL22_06225 [Solirubrobacteraceae bacterium]